MRHEAISVLCDYIWKYRETKLAEIELMSEENKKKAKENPYMSLRALKET